LRVEKGVVRKRISKLVQARAAREALPCEEKRGLRGEGRPAFRGGEVGHELLHDRWAAREAKLGKELQSCMAGI